ncbi:hypothetical protein Glove_543g112 [Diversispora epigaea]|uniref:Uncharacterized protein n=1 Tax=Diversispora epigaea TaxID=1348612 RepID=A0A397GI56_9GLOM|nr:hypothetical protein Glove_543g112 [Diversispora epigaea]
MTKFQQEENFPVQKGKNFEIKIKKLLTDANIKCEITVVKNRKHSVAFVFDITYKERPSYS